MSLADLRFEMKSPARASVDSQIGNLKMDRPFYKYLTALDAYRTKIQQEWTDAERCRTRIARVERALVPTTHPRLKR